MSLPLFLPRVPWVRVLAVLAVSLLLHALLLAVLRGNLVMPDFSRLSPEAPPLLTTLVTEPAPVEAPKKSRPRPPRPQPPVIEPAPIEASPPLPAEAAAPPVPPSDLPQETPPQSETADAPTEAVQDSEAVQADAESNLAQLMAAQGAARTSDIPTRALYRYRVSYSRLAGMSGTMQIGWTFNVDTREYRMYSLVDGLNLTLLRQSSSGRLQDWGLAPERYVERRLRRSPLAANLDWQQRKSTFSSREYERPIEEGAQDRLSFLFQLTLLAQQLPEKFVPGRSVNLRVVGTTDVVTYRMQVVGTEQIRVPQGLVEAVYLDRPKLADMPDSDRRVEVWLAPSLRWQVVKMRFTERRGDVFEAVLESTARGDLELPAELTTN